MQRVIFDFRTGAITQADLTAEEIAELPRPTAADLAVSVSALVEATARSMEYKSGAHCAGYVSSTVPQWAAEAQAFVAWRDAVWLAVYALDPAAPPASISAALAQLPPFVRPGA